MPKRQVDPVYRDASRMNDMSRSAYEGKVPAAMDALPGLQKNYSESVRRRFRQSEDAGSGGYMNDATHTTIDGAENKG